MVLLVLSCLLLIVSVIFPIIIFKKAKLIDESMYDVKTGSAKAYFVFSYVFLGIGLLSNIASIVMYFLKIVEGQIVLFVFAAIFALISILILYCTNFDYEAIKENKVIIHRFFKFKEIEISNIKTVNVAPNAVMFLDKNMHKLFMVDRVTGNLENFLLVLKEKSNSLADGFVFNNGNFAFKTNDVNNDENDNNYKNKIYEQIGKEYKESIPSKKKRLIFILVIIIIFEIAFLFFSYSFGLNVIFIIILCLVADFMFLINNNKKYNKELQKTDYELGVMYYNLNPKVKGHNRIQYKNSKITIFVIMGLGLMMSLLTFAITSEKPNVYEEMDYVTGVIDYIGIEPNEADYIFLGLKENDIEYRLSSIYFDELDNSIFDELSTGDTIHLYVEKNVRTASSVYDESKEKWTYFSYLSTDLKEYFTYEDYLAGFKNKQIGVAFGIASAVVSVVCIPILFVLKSHYKKKEEDETIDVY